MNRAAQTRPRLIEVAGSRRPNPALGDSGRSIRPAGTMRYLVLDIEAVRDPSVWTPPPEKPDAFAPPYAWRPICIGCVLIDGETLETVKVGAITQSSHVEAVGDRELSVLAGFAKVMRQPSPTIVTWNGRHFDVPVLMQRSMRYGFAHPWYYGGRDARYRFSDAGHCDLADSIADYGASSALGLDGVAKLCGLPGKFGDIDGAGVAAAYAAGRLPEIVNYCVSDAVQTAFLLLRWWMLKGEVSGDAYRAGARSLLAACEAHGGLYEFVARVDRRVLLLENKEG
jgi:predicted PolB exonuclease-like 3'-5' exonuclease